MSPGRSVDNWKGILPRPSTAMRVLESIDDPDLAMNKLADIIALDPLLTARVIRLANSPLHRRGELVGAVRAALTQLGAKTVQALVAGASLPLLSGEADLGPEEVWVHSVTVAATAKGVAPFLGVPPDLAFTCGLLHDIGASVIYHREREAHPDDDPSVAVSAMYGEDHPVIGAQAAREAGMPQNVVEAIRDHHRYPGSAGRLAQTIMVAESIASTIDPKSVDEETRPLPQLLELVRVAARPDKLVEMARKEIDRTARAVEGSA